MCQYVNGGVMGSSDDSFAWTDASSDSFSSVHFEMKSIQTKSEEDMDSGYDYKKILHDKLFQETPETKKSKKGKKRKHEDLLQDVEDNNDYDSSIVNKIIFESDGAFSNSGNDLDTSIKEEPSDTAHSEHKKKKKHKKTHGEDSGLDVDAINSTLEVTNNYTMEESYENQMTSPKKNKKRKRKLSTNSNNESDDVYDKSSVREKKKMKLNNSYEAFEHPSDNTSTVYNGHIGEGLDSSILLNSSEIENKVEKNTPINDKSTKLKPSKRVSKRSGEIQFENDNSLSTDQKNKYSFNDTSTNIKHSKRDSKISNKVQFENESSFSTEQVNNNPTTDTPSKSKHSKRVSKISDILQFENENSLSTEQENNTPSNDTPTKLKHSKRVSKKSDKIEFENRNSLGTEHIEHAPDDSILLNDNVKGFLSSNPQLKLSNVLNSSNDSEDEEQWILNCPADVNIEDFNNIDLVLGKNKIKINEQTYSQNKDEAIRNVMHIKYHRNRSVINNVPVVEAYIFSKRIPKAHISNDNIIINNQTNFIPLPDTKCRHPLFGEKYKKSIKISKSAAERLAEEGTTSNTIIKKKKHKKEKTNVEEISELEVSVADPEPYTALKKKKKKHSSKEVEHKLSKKTKQETKTETTWESEKAIEENLFNF